MQNGKAALSLITYDDSKPSNKLDFAKLLDTIYQHNGKTTKIAVSFFYPNYSGFYHIGNLILLIVTELILHVIPICGLWTH